LRTPFESNPAFDDDRRACDEPPAATFSLVTVTPCLLDHKKAANHTWTEIDLKNRTVRYTRQTPRGIREVGVSSLLKVAERGCALD